MQTRVKYETSWTWIGDTALRYNVNKVIRINGKPKRITRIKCFATEVEAQNYANKLNKEVK
jgi:hypothetical protein